MVSYTENQLPKANQNTLVDRRGSIHTMSTLVNLYIANWKDPPFFMGKLTISMAILNSYLHVYQRVIGRVPFKYHLMTIGRVPPN